MKHNKFLIVLTLCAAMQTNVYFCSEAPQTEAPQSQSYWHRIKNYVASWIPQSSKNIVNSLSIQKIEIALICLQAATSPNWRENMPLINKALKLEPNPSAASLAEFALLALNADSITRRNAQRILELKKEYSDEIK